jgi:hypothetical protein
LQGDVMKNYVAPKDRMPAPQSDKELDMISPEARRMMEQKKKDMEQEKKQKDMETKGKKAGGKVKKYASGGSVSKRADGCAMKGKTRGKMV